MTELIADVVLWDYDGTLVNSAAKNIEITKEIISIVAPRLTGKNLPKSLMSENAYHEANHKAKNWQDLYINYYGMTEKETMKAGPMWTEFQLKSKVEVQLFEGVKETIQKLTFIPHGICSQNSAKNIREVLVKNDLNNSFKSVIGYDDISSNSQKPNPESGLKCLTQIFGTYENKTIVYIGDHEGDVQFARNISVNIGNDNKVISIAVTYSGAILENWSFKPDITISKPEELLNFIVE